MNAAVTIDLAPHHKLGLVVANPILLAGGVIGSGDALPAGLALSQLGAAVIGPITLRSRAGSVLPRLADFPGGFVLETGLQNRGIDATLRHFARLWPRLGCPVIAQLADAQPGAAAAVAERLAVADGIVGLELLTPRTADADLLRKLIDAVARASDLPVWVKLPLESAAALAASGVDAGAVGIVVGQPVLGALARQAPDGATHWVAGNVFGPAVYPQMLKSLLDVAALHLPCALIACGGIHTQHDVRQVLIAGAHAAQIDSLAWVEPAFVARLCEEASQGGGE